MTQFREWLNGTRRSHPVWLGLVAASALFMLPLLFAPLTDAGGVSHAQGAWQPLGLQGESVLAFSAVALDGNTVLYAQTHSGLWRTRHAAGEARDWERIDQDLPHSALGVPQIAAWASVSGQPLRMYALAGPEDARQLYRSEDGGASWQAVGPAVGQSRAPAFAVLPGPAGGPDVIMIATASRLQRSLDGGATWTPGGPWPDEAGNQGRLPTEDAVRALLVEARTPDRILAVSDSGALWVSENSGLSWHAAGLQDYQVSAVGLAAGAAEWAIALRDGAPTLLFSVDKLTTWDSRPLPEAAAPAFAGAAQATALAPEPGIRDSVYVAMRGGKVYRTVDGGRAWAALGALRGGQVTALAVAPGSAAALYATTDDGVWVRPVAPVIPTATPTHTAPPSPTAPPEATATRPPSTATPTGTDTATPTAPPEATATPTLTATPTPTATRTATRPVIRPTRRASATPQPQQSPPTSAPTVTPGSPPGGPSTTEPGPPPIQPTSVSPEPIVPTPPIR